MLISYGYEPERPVNVRAFTSQVDIAPTILAECGLPAPGSWAGRALQEPASPDFTFFEQKVYLGVIDHRDPRNVLKYWLDTSAGTEHAFNLSSDPAENTDVLAGTPPDRRQEWRLHALTGVASL